MDRLKIDQVALQSGLTKRAIRYYEEIGMIPPPQRSKGGIRYYTQEHVELLKKIKYTKDALGISLEELQKFISFSQTIDAQKGDCQQAIEQTEQKEKLLEIINDLNEVITIIDQKISKIEHVRNDLINLKERAQACVDTIDPKKSKS
ncbi:MAG TPA: MerR family transcriptional regulator [Syntrophomonadaceae bacterium]|nr:MerR family transcriptional regulator [Syntrophomonadaceae bacterium]